MAPETLGLLVPGTPLVTRAAVYVSVSLLPSIFSLTLLSLVASLLSPECDMSPQACVFEQLVPSSRSQSRDVLLTGL